MKMRASLLQFAIALVTVVSVAVACLAFVHRNLARSAKLEARSNDSSALSTQIGTQYGRLPLSFEVNMGQTDPQVQFLAHGYGYELFLTHRDAVLALRRSAPVRLSYSNRVDYLKELRRADQSAKTSVLRLHFAGANSAAAISGLGRLPGRTDYFIGNDPKSWRTGVPSYAQVAYHGIYPGIDAVFYGNQKQMEYDLRVSPGAKPTSIALDVEGASALSVDASGNLMMRVADADVILTKPVAYQDLNGQRREIAANYVIDAGNRVTFSIGGYDTTKPIVIDPVLDYSTYLGGSAGNSTFGLTDFGYGIAVDSSGDAYVAGQTFSLKFPTTAGGYTTSPLASNPNGAVFVTEMNPAGTAEVYSTYLIGSDTQGDYGFAIALDPSGNIYVTGQTFSTGFPTTANAAETAPTDAATVTSVGTAFLSKINPNMSGTNSLVYSSYLGGSGAANGGDIGWAVAADANNNAYIAGNTYSSDFLTAVTSTTGYQTSNSDTSNGVGFLAVVNTTASGAASLLYSTYLGGNGVNAGTGYGDVAFGVAADSSGNAYLVGLTTSSNFLAVNALQSGPNGSNSSGEAFVSRIDTTKTGTNSLVYSTYLGGDVFDVANAVALEPSNATPANAVYVTGQTASTKFPVTTGAYSSAVTGSGVAFVTLLDTTQSGSASLKYSAVIGGSDGDQGYGIKADSSGNAYVVGTTGSPDFPVTAGAFQTADNNSQGTAFVFELNPGGNGNADLFYSTYFGGTGPGGDAGTAIALGPSNNVYITGTTGSTSNFPIFPTTTAFQTTMTKFDAAATSAAFVAELTLQPTISLSATTLAFGNVPVNTTATACGGLSPCAVTVANNTSAAITITIGPITATPPSVATDFASTSTCGTPAVVPAGGNCTITVTFTPSVVQAETATLPISFIAGNNTVATTENITLTGTGTVFTVTPTTLPSFGFQLITSTSNSQQVTVTNTSAAALAFTSSASANFGENDTCGGMVAALGSCTLNVTFTPTTTGPLTGTLTVTSGGQNQMVQLSGSGGDFSVTMPASISVTGNSGSGSANLTATTGFTPSVSFTCTTTIPNGSCSAPTTTAPNSFTISVSVSSLVPPSTQRFDGWKMVRLIVPVVAVMLALLALPLVRRRRAWIGLAAVVVVAGLFSACSGSKSAKTYSLSLTASSTSNGTTVSHNYTTPVSVQ